MKKVFTLLTLALAVCSGAWAEDITLTFAYDQINATGAGTASVSNVFENSSVALVGTNLSQLSFNGTGSAATYNSVAVPAYSKVSVADGENSAADDGVRFTITLAEGCTFTPTSVSLGAIREGTDAGSMYVYANGTALNEATLAKSPVSPGRNKTGDSYTKDGYSFSYNISAVTADSDHPLTIDVCMSGLKKKSWGLWNVVVTGTYTKVAVTTYELTTTADPAAGGEITRSPNAGSYSAGKSVALTATPNYGYEFVNWTKGSVVQGTAATLNITTAAAAEEYVAHFNALSTYALTVNAGVGGTVSKTPDHDAYLAGDEVTLTATPNEGYAFVNWTDDNNSDAEVSTSASYTYTTTAAAASFTANFVKLFSVTYDIDDYINTTTKALNNFNAANGINEKYADKDGNYTIPSYSHYYMYRAGFMFKKWEDQDGNQYEKGTTITGITKDITLTPVWEATTQTLENSAAECTVTWNFGKSTILFNGWQYAPQVGYYTKPQTVNGELIALPMIVNTTSGKVDNSTRTDALAQVNGGTVFTIPAIKGMTVVLTANKNITNTTVGGNKPDSGSGTTEATYNYTGENGTTDIVINDGSYYSSIKVTYPAMTVAITPSKEYTSFSSDKALDFSSFADELEAYTVSTLTKTEATLNKVTAAPANTGLVLKKIADKTFYVPIVATASAVGTNYLKAAVTATTVDANSTYVLSDGKFSLFTGTTIPAGKAYLDKTDVPAAARELSFNFGGETTGISEKITVNSDKFATAPVYNLNGQRVSQPARGLYIVNGKKVVVK